MELESIDLEFYRVPKFALLVLGFWPETKLTPIRIIHGVINLIILSWAVISEMCSGFMLIQQPIVALDAIAPSLSKLVTILKLTVMWTSRIRFRILVNDAYDLLQVDNSEKKLKILKKMKKFTAALGFIVFLLGNATNAAYFFRPIVNNALDYYNGRNVTREMPFIAWVPFPTTNIVAYCLGYMVNSYFGFIAAFGFGGVDGFFVQSCMYLSTLFQICREDAKLAFFAGTFNVASVEQNIITRKKLSAAIEKHNKIMDMCEELVDLFTLIILAHFLSAALVICVTAIDFLMASGFNIVVYVVHSLMVIFELFVYCIGGTGVFESSIDVARAVYFREWYKYDISTQKMIGLIMVRSQKGTNVQVPFFAPSIPVFGTMLGTAMSYITLLRTFLQR
ncbi:unnamed protein product [Hermetia illucens]|uniref:Odorant receptor n=1 Tax=Hermetia illucens TaxID=343691 RepID=A0A7R8UVR9_HERIL|nr:odorant receptor 22c-like [Hermetia illucens]CAD7088027.1 unnamed protein product [Hermetia illucens]